MPAGPAVIDLTLDSSDEDDEPLPPPPPRPAARRESTQRGASSTSAARFGSAAAAVQDAFGSPGAGYVNGNSAASAVARRESAAAAEVGHLSEESEGPRRPYKRPRLQLRDLDYDDEFPDDGDHSDDAPLAAHHQRNGTGSGSHGAARASDAHGVSQSARYQPTVRARTSEDGGNAPMAQGMRRHASSTHGADGQHGFAHWRGDGGDGGSAWRRATPTGAPASGWRSAESAQRDFEAEAAAAREAQRARDRRAIHAAVSAGATIDEDEEREAALARDAEMRALETGASSS